VQQALTKAGAVERFLPPEKAEKVRKTFMVPMQVLDNSPAGLEAQAAATDPEECVKYVLKPNRDGGGHNVYRSDIPKFLASKPKEAWVQYILMRLIEPPPTTGTLMLPEDLYHGAVISELGVLATCIWERKDEDLDVKMNEAAGWTFKTKPATVDEMAVVKGYGCFDCPLLIDDTNG
jgi:glutathione synthase